MNDSDAALEHLRMIRGLMERATVYRAVTVPTALAGGLLAGATATVLFLLDERLDPASVVLAWLAVFAVVNAFHHGLIWRTARREGEPYLSSGLKMALKAIIPAIFAGGILGIALGLGPRPDVVGTSLLWATFYGLALMATSGFSPRSLRVLGLAFTLVGSVLLGIHWGQADGVSSAGGQRTSAIIMGTTFGAFHLVYGSVVWGLRRRSGALPSCRFS